jgi:hypothetical protein
MEDKSYESGASALASRPKPPKTPSKKVIKIIAKKVKGGFHAVTQHAHPAHPDIESVNPDLDSLMAHMKAKWGSSTNSAAAPVQEAPMEDEAPQE